MSDAKSQSRKPSKPKHSKKRRHEETQDSAATAATTATSTKSASQDTPAEETHSQSQRKAKKQKRAKKDESKDDGAAFTSANKDTDKKDGINESIGKMNGPLLADFLAKQIQRHNKEMTAVELNDLYIPEGAFKDTSSWQETRNLENLPSFLKSQWPNGGKNLSIAPEQKGSPHTLVITAAGLRAADLTRSLRAFQNKECAVAKLFAKHIKFEEAKTFVPNTRIGVGVGTPARIRDLAKTENCLKLDHLERIVIDGSHLDQKKRSIFDMKEIFAPLLEFLTRPELIQRYTSLGKDKHGDTFEEESPTNKPFETLKKHVVETPIDR
ncbi:ribosomal protein S15 [Ascosphaera pollenicola]|nr:ribosomal protein S15 [Ascosphaera pollenicola]